QQVQVQGTGTLLHGQVVSTGNGQFIVRGGNGQNMTFYTNPTTRYFNNNQAAQWGAVQPGIWVNAWYGAPQNGQLYANTVAVVPQSTTTTTQVQPAPAVATTYQGQVVRTVGQDQVIIRTADGKEITVFTNPQTTYQLNNQPATFTQLQPGVPVDVNY